MTTALDSYSDGNTQKGHMVGINLSILGVTAIRTEQTDKRDAVNGGDDRWERLHTLHSGGCGFEGALLPV